MLATASKPRRIDQEGREASDLEFLILYEVQDLLGRDAIVQNKTHPSTIHELRG